MLNLGDHQHVTADEVILQLLSINMIKGAWHGGRFFCSRCRPLHELSQLLSYLCSQSCCLRTEIASELLQQSIA